MSTRELIIDHYRKYPALEVRDIFKFLFQSSFGCEHLVASEEIALDYVKKEYERMPKSDRTNRIDPLDGDYVRVHLSCLNDRLTPEVLARYFCLSAKKEPEGKARLVEKLGIARELIVDGTLPLPLSEFDELHTKWRDAGYPAIHHSDAFREAYHPAYRVISREYSELLSEHMK